MRLLVIHWGEGRGESGRRRVAVVAAVVILRELGRAYFAGRFGSEGRRVHLSLGKKRGKLQ